MPHSNHNRFGVVRHALFVLSLLGAFALPAQVAINEVMFHQDETSAENTRNHDWIELYNADNQDLNLDDWRLVNQGGDLLFLFSNGIQWPKHTYLLVHFSTGVDDLDFSDGAGHLYTGDADDFDALLLDQDAIGLFSGPVSGGALIDFLSWKHAQALYLPTALDTMAWVEGQWEENTFFNALDAARKPGEFIQPVDPGTTIGRDQNSQDQDKWQDWDIDGGENAYDLTPGNQNRLLSQIVFEEELPPEAALLPKKWTYLYYASTDNNVEKALFNNLDEMEAVGSTDDINIVVMLDLAPGYAPVQVSFDNGATWAPTTTAYRGQLRANSQPKRVRLHYPSSTTADLGEVNMGDPNTLAGFVNWAATHYPADNYALVLFDHGYNWKANTYDDSQNDELHMNELKAALTAMDVNPALIGFEECMMGMLEVAYQVAPYCEVMVGSESTIRAHGWPHNTILEYLKNNPGSSAETLGNQVVSKMEAFHATRPGDPYSISAIALDGRLTTLANHVSQYGEELKAGCDDYGPIYLIHYIQEDNVQMLISEALDDTQDFSNKGVPATPADENAIDLYDFTLEVEAAGVPEVYRATGADIPFDIEGNAVLSESHSSHFPDAHGISIYFPAYQTKEDGETDRGEPYDNAFDAYKVSRAEGTQTKYSFDPDDGTPTGNVVNHPHIPAPDFRFPTDKLWDEFLHRYYEPCADAGEDKKAYVDELVWLDGSGSTDADGVVTEWYWDFNLTANTDPDDYDKDALDEFNDDNNFQGELAFFSSPVPGIFPIMLTVWDDHIDYHADHYETDQDLVIVTIYDSLKTATLIPTPTTCPGMSDGQAELTIPGGIPPYTIHWSDGQEGPIATGLASGPISYTITDDHGSTLTGSGFIPEPPPILPFPGFGFPYCPDDSTGFIFLDIVGGTPPYFVEWDNGIIGPELPGMPAGVYTAFIYDNNGCLIVQAYELTSLDTEAPLVVAYPNPLVLDVGGMVYLDPAVMNVQASDNCALEAIVFDPPLFSCEDIGTQIVTVTVFDNSGNSTSIDVLVDVVDWDNPIVNPPVITIPLGPDGTVTITPDFYAEWSYDNCGIAAWMLSQTTFDCSNVGPNELLFTAIDWSGNMTTAVLTLIVEDQSPPTVLVSNITLWLDASGQAFLSAPDIDAGTFDNCGILSMEIGQTGFSCEDLLPEAVIEVDLIVTDIHGNVGTATAEVTLIDPIPPQVFCPENITTTFCGPVSYDLPQVIDNCVTTLEQTEGLASGEVFPVGATTQTFVATDLYGNQAECNFVVTVESDFLLDLSLTPVSCHAGSDGSVEVLVTGGTPPYVYAWSGGGSAGLPAGEYTVSITDTYGCETVGSFEITQPDPIELEVVSVENETNSQANGAFTLSASGGTPPFEYEEMPFTDTLTVSGLAAGTYNVVIYDANGCEQTISLTIENINGVSEPEVLQQFLLFPNPAKGYAMLDIRFLQPSWMQLSLVDVNGRTLQSWAPATVPEYTLRIDLGDMAPGIYAVRLHVAGEMVVRTLVVEK